MKKFKPYLSWIISAFVILVVILGINKCQTEPTENTLPDNDSIQNDTIPIKTSNTSNKINGHEFVDLGLPSGTLWATCNVGASKPSDYGKYYAWGETTTKLSYEEDNLKYWSWEHCYFTKYVTERKYGIVDHKTRLDMQDDAASARWGGSWRTPTLEEWVELTNNCEWEETPEDGHSGWKVTSEKNGNSIYLPAAGSYDNYGLCGIGQIGYYWSSTLSAHDSNDAYSCSFSWEIYDPSSWSSRSFGLSVRPVSSSSQN